jgi:hypothetical protein
LFASDSANYAGSSPFRTIQFDALCTSIYIVFLTLVYFDRTVQYILKEMEVSTIYLKIIVAGRRFPQGTVRDVFKGLNLAFWWKV